MAPIQSLVSHRTFESRSQRIVTQGKPYPLGATLTGDGANFALYSKHATDVALLLFDSPDGSPTDVIPLPCRTRYVWHGFVHGIQANQLYGYRVNGPFEPALGHRFNPHKVLIDPYAKALSHKLVNPDRVLNGFDATSPRFDLSMDCRDSSTVVPKALVIDDAFDWQADRQLDLPFRTLIIYEMHVRGFTKHRSSGVSKPGTYLGLIEKIPYLKSLGVNAVELLPVHEFASEGFLTERGLTNYWGYNTVSFFAPESSYAHSSAPGAAVHEFKTLVRALHKAGMEVILDVVYNHTAESDESGPTFSWRGIDNVTYYCLSGPDDEPRRKYANFSGCGNALNLSDSPVIRMVMDSLRYWVETMHVDGFRFDLASVLGRQNGSFTRAASFFDVVAQDPVLSRVKLIAEPWDVESCEVGNFPVEWSEWNAQFRDTMRRFGIGTPGLLAQMGCRLTGSSDLYGHNGRGPHHSINYITCHDGFTLADLVSYERKHNEANREANRDGSDENYSCNGGHEGPTTDPQIVERRTRLAKNHLCHLLFSLGTPMLLAGDEVLRTQQGNNNAYCQDNEISWLDWQETPERQAFLRFVKLAIAFRKNHGILHRGTFHNGHDTNGDSVPDITWFDENLNETNWDDPQGRLLCYRLDGAEDAESGSPQLFYFILNASDELRHVRLPGLAPGQCWKRVIDTALASPEDFMNPGHEVRLDPPDYYLANPMSTVVLVASALCRK